MKNFLKATLLVIALVAILAIYTVSKRNSFVAMEANIERQWAQVESQYQRRFDLVPNLVSSVRGIMDQEKEIFENIAEARTRYANAGSLDEKVNALNSYDGELSKLLLIMENYPQLRSADTVQSLMTELAGTENRIAVERMRYNDAVTEYNTEINLVPGNIVAKWFGFEKRELFKSSGGASEAPEVSL